MYYLVVVWLSIYQATSAIDCLERLVSELTHSYTHPLSLVVHRIQRLLYIVAYISDRC